MKKLASVSKQKLTDTNVESLIEMLANKNGVTRTKSRKSLVALGKIAVPTLISTLQNSKLDHLRWEAAKTLGAIGDIKAIPSLVKALEDRDQDVAWVAGVALKKFKKAAWPTLLRGLIKRKSYSVFLCQGAHHVFRNQKEKGFNDLLPILTKALESGSVPASIAIAAYDILKQMKIKL